MSYSLKQDGDKLERYACQISLLPDDFPSYELFWKKFVIPLTYRTEKRVDVRLRADKDLLADERSNHAKICIAQLHYSVLANLIVAKDIIFKKIDYSKSGVDLARMDHFFMNAFTAVDIAGELILRYEDLPCLELDPWSDDSIITLRRDFQDKEPNEIKTTRKYRNRLVHGRLMPGFREWPSGHDQFVPKIGKEENYLDWRKITSEAIDQDDFQPAQEIMEETFKLVTDYLDSMWREYLIEPKNETKQEI